MDEDAPHTRWSSANPGNQMIVSERTRCVRRALTAARLLPLDTRRVLDVGCGNGQVLADLTEWAGGNHSNLFGIDLVPRFIEDGKRRFPRMNLQVGNAEDIDFPDDHFDLVLLFTVFSSILSDEMSKNVAGEVNRVLKSGGAVVWYDLRYSNPRNPCVRAVSGQRLQEYFPEYSRRLWTVTLLPPLARHLGRVTKVAYPILTRLPFLRTHYVGLLSKPLSSSQAATSEER
jgi:ubiquinone/menaquinone biosynthesis C-methylase UbiE